MRPGNSPIGTSQRARTVALTTAASAIVFTDAGMPVLGPELRQSFALTLTGLGWVGGAYALTIALLLLPASAFAGRIGPRRALQIGLLLFTAGTVALSLAPSGEVLIAGRFLQGAGTAVISPTMLAALRTQCGNPCGKAVAWWSGISSSMVAVGSLTAATVVGITSWRVYFATAIVLLLISVVLVSCSLPDIRLSRTALPARLVAGASVAFAGAYLALVLRRADLLLVPLALAAWWVCQSAHQRRRRRRGISQPSLVSRAFTAPAFAGLIVGGLLYSIVFLVPLYDRLVLGVSATDAALSLVVIAAPPIAFGPVISRWSARSGARVPMIVGALMLMVAMASATTWTAHDHLYDTLPALLLAGCGLAGLMAPSTAAAMAALPENLVVEGAAVLAAARALGVSLGAGATTGFAADRRTCDLISHFCHEALSTTLKRPLLPGAVVAALLALFLLAVLRRPAPQLQ